MEANLVQFIEESEESIVRLTQTLVRQNSANPPGDVSDIATTALQAIRQLMPEATTSTYRVESSGVVNLVARFEGRGPGPCRRICFSGHLDTYPFGDLDKWTDSPISGNADWNEGRVYGRGASDMKGGIAASIIAAAALSKYADSWSGEIIIALAGDEETMGEMGTGYLLKHVEHVARVDAVICGDAGSPNIIRIGEKGLVWVEIQAIGSSAHGAHVHRGVNAIGRLMKALQAVKGLEKATINMPSMVQDAIDKAKPISESLGGIGEAEVLKRVTVNIGKISGGTSANLVPAKAEASLDIRLPSGITTAEIENQLQSALSSMEGVTYRVIRKYDPSWTSPLEKIVQDCQAAAKAILSTDTAVNSRVGASDTRLFRRAGIPSVVIGVTPYNMGGPDEYVMIEELMKVSQIHCLAAWNFLSS